MKVGIEHYLYGMTPYITTVIKEEADLSEQDQEDVVQETLYRALRYQCGWESREEAMEGTQASYKDGRLSVKPHQGKASAGWLATIAKNCVKDKLDFINKHELLKGVDIENLCANNSNTPEQEVLVSQILKAGDYMEGEERDVFLSVVLGRMTAKEYAESVRVSHGHIRNVVTQAKKKVKEILGE